MHSANLSDTDFEKASALARRFIDTLLNAPASPGSLGHVGAPVQEERDFWLAHAAFHATAAANAAADLRPGLPLHGRDASDARPELVVAVFGAAHVAGVAQQFGTFRARGCTAQRCAIEPELRRLDQVNWTPVYAAGGALFLTSGAGMFGRWMFVRHLRFRPYS